VVRLIYWLAFQARFPYETNTAALQAAVYRREVAGLLTTHRFGKDLVAPARSLDRINGRYSFVTEYIPGEKAKNDEEAKAFLAQVTQTFAEAGLSVWQVNPRNPHAHTNLIRTPEGDFKIIDLESALATPLPAPGQWRSALRSGNFPIFDDIDFPRMRGYVSANGDSLKVSLGPDGLAQLHDAIDRCEQSIRSWKESEPRIWGRFTRTLYRLLNWKPFFQRMSVSFDGADEKAERFLNSGIERWMGEGRIEPSEAAALRNRLSTGEARDALHHLGAHLVISAILRFPLGSVGRFVWTLSFWGMAATRRFRQVLRRDMIVHNYHGQENQEGGQHASSAHPQYYLRLDHRPDY